MIDIADKAQLVQYLLDKDIIKKDSDYFIKYCKGGVSGTVVYLKVDGKEMIVKQALAQLKTKETWLCDPNRMFTEQESNRIYHEILPTASPEVYFYDGDNYIYCREAIPDGCDMWKSDLMTGKLDFECARKSIEILALVHNHCSRDKRVAEIFDNKDIFYSLRISPYLEFTSAKHPALESIFTQYSKKLMDSKLTLIHGDFSPKNIMVNGRDISVLDFEVAHYGHPMFDMAFFANHFVLKSIRFPELKDAFLNMLLYMCHIYFKNIDFTDAKELELDSVRLLALLMLARVDGKSPVEYIKEDEMKEVVRTIAYKIIENNLSTFDEVAKLIISLTRRDI